MARSEQAATEPGNKPEREVLVEEFNLKQPGCRGVSFDGKMIEMMILAALAMQRMNIYVNKPEGGFSWRLEFEAAGGGMGGVFYWKMIKGMLMVALTMKRMNLSVMRILVVGKMKMRMVMIKRIDKPGGCNCEENN